MEKLILVYGPSSSGKSSIKKHLETIAPYLVLEDEDDAHKVYAVELMAEYSKSNYLVLSDSMSIHDIFVAVLHGYKHLRTESMISDKQMVACNFFQKNWHKIIRHKDPNVGQFKMFQRIIKQVKHGKKGVIFTSNIQILEKHKHNIDKNIQVLRIFVYCPLQELCRRIIERNNVSDNPADCRIGLFPIIQLSEYLKYRDSNNLVLIDTISLQTLYQCLQDVIKSFKNGDFNNINLEEITKKFGFTKDSKKQKLEYTLATFCDHMINTHIHSPEQSGECIVKLINS